MASCSLAVVMRKRPFYVLMVVSCTLYLLTRGKQLVRCGLKPELGKRTYLCCEEVGTCLFSCSLTIVINLRFTQILTELCEGLSATISDTMD